MEQQKDSYLTIEGQAEAIFKERSSKFLTYAYPVESEEEINSAKKAIATLGGKIEKCVDYTIPGTDVSHRLVLIKKVAPTPKKYPRAFAKIKKSPL